MRADRLQVTNHGGAIPVGEEEVTIANAVCEEIRDTHREEEKRPLGQPV